MPALCGSPSGEDPVQPNRVKEKLRTGAVVAGIFTLANDPHVTGVIASAGFDFVMYDLEHTSLSFERLEWLVRAADATGIVPLTRVASASKRDILPALEAGVRGIMVPVVETSVDAREAVRHALYYPDGQRGMYYLGYASGYAGLSLAEHFQSSNRELLLIAQIETERGVANAAEIAAVPGLDCLFVGPADLSQSLGAPGDWEHPRLVEAVERVITVASAAGKTAGFLPTTPARTRAWLQAGARFLAWNQDMAIFKRALGEEVRTLQADFGWSPRG